MTLHILKRSLFAIINEFFNDIRFIYYAIIEIVCCEKHLGIDSHRHVIGHTIINHVQDIIRISVLILASMLYFVFQMSLVSN